MKDFLALELSKTMEKFNAQGLQVEAVETRPPGKNQGQGKKRVISIKKIRPEVFRITWSFENYK